MLALEILVVWFLLTTTVLVIFAWIGLLISIMLGEWVHPPLDRLPSLVLFSLVAMLPIAVLVAVIFI